MVTYKEELDNIKEEQKKIIEELNTLKGNQESNKVDNPKDILMIHVLKKEGFDDREIETFRQRERGVKRE